MFPNGVKLSGYQGEYVFEKIEKSQDFYEKHMLQKWFANENVKVIYDIGANIGNHTVYFANSAKHAQVFSFEPHPENFVVLTKNVLDNRLENRVRTFKMAAGSTQGIVYLNVKQNANLGTASVVPTAEESSTDCQVSPIDALELPMPDFIKIDVEGFELQVLKGMENTLKKSENAIIWTEIDDDNANEVYDFMTQMGYSIADFSLEANNNVLWTKEKRLDERHLLLKLLTDNELKQNFIEANHKYRNLTKKYADLKNSFDDANNKYLNVSENYTSLNSKLDDSNSKYREITEKYTMLKAQLEESNNKYLEVSENYSKLKSKLTASDNQCQKILKDFALQKAESEEKNVQIKSLEDKLKTERVMYLEQLTCSSKSQAETATQLSDATAKYAHERSLLFGKITFATLELGTAIKLLSTADLELHRLRGQVSVLQKENSQYQWKLNRVINTWYGKYAIKAYRKFNQIKRRLKA